MSILESMILGFIQGITEFFPISSSGHLLISRRIFHVEEYGLLLEVALHIGTLFSILFYWRKDILFEIKEFSFNENNFLLNIIFATIPAGIVGLIYKDKINELFFDINHTSYLIFAYLIMAFLLYQSKYYYNNNINKIGVKYAFLIGIAQSFAMIPGISRSGLTIIVALFLGISFLKYCLPL